MKKIISLLSLTLVAGTIYAQILDTVLVRNLTMQAQDYAWFVGKNASNTDSISIKAIRRIRNTVQANVPQTWTTNVTVDSLPGSVVVSMYSQVLNAPAAEISARYTAIKNAISSKTNLLYWIGFLDATPIIDFNRKRDVGRQVLIDNN